MNRLFLIALLLVTSFAHATEWQNNQEVADLFAQANVTGTFVLFDVSSQRLLGHNQPRAETPLVPASTFKIPNTLIGLSVGAVKSVDEVFPYDGKPRAFDSWEKDMALREAIAASNVPVYQELARRIGLQRMQAQVTKLQYGNAKIGSQVDNFWLQGPLKISAVEQTRFLAQLAAGELPFPKEHQQSVREIVKLEQQGNWTLYGKTGWENAPDAGVGWWVGWVEKDGRIYSFALNMDMKQASDAARRVDLGKASLKALGII